MARFSNPFSQYFSDSGRVLPGAKLSFFINGTTTPQTTYADAAFTVPNPNPVICDAAGRVPDIYMPGNLLYSIRLTDTNDVQIAQADDITGTDSRVSSSDVIAALAANTDPVIINGSSIDLNADTDIDGDLSTTGNIVLPNNVALQGQDTSFPPVAQDLIKLNTSDQVEIDSGGNGTLISGVTEIAQTSSGAEVKVQELRNNATANNTAVMQKFVNSTVEGSNSGSTELVATRTSGNIGSFTIRVSDVLSNMQDVVTLTSDDATFSTTSQFNGNSNWGTFSASGASKGVQINFASNINRINISATTTAAETHEGFYNPNGNVGSITTNGSATAFNTASDPRLKTEFKPFDIELAWSKFDQIYGASGIFQFINDPSKDVWGLDAHKLIDAGIDAGTEGQGPRDLNIGDVYEKAVIKQRPKMAPELDENDNPTGELIDSGELEDYEAEPEKIVTPAGVDQSKLVPYLLPLIYDLREQLAKANQEISKLKEK